MDATRPRAHAHMRIARTLRALDRRAILARNSAICNQVVGKTGSSPYEDHNIYRRCTEVESSCRGVSFLASVGPRLKNGKRIQGIIAEHSQASRTARAPGTGGVLAPTR